MSSFELRHSLVKEDWRKEYNELRPHSDLGYAPPSVFSMHPKALFAQPVPHYDAGLSSPSGVAV